VAQHRPTGSETTPPYATRSSRFGSELPSVEDDVDVWRYAILRVACQKQRRQIDVCFGGSISRSDHSATVCIACMAIRPWRFRVQIPGCDVCWFMQANQGVFTDLTEHGAWLLQHPTTLTPIDSPHSPPTLHDTLLQILTDLNDTCNNHRRVLDTRGTFFQLTLNIYWPMTPSSEKMKVASSLVDRNGRLPPGLRLLPA